MPIRTAPELKKNIFKLGILSCLFLYIIGLLSLILMSSNYTRPHIYYIITAIQLVILVYIGTKVKSYFDSSIVLGILVLVILTFSWSQIYLFPYVIGVDPWTHMKFNNEIINLGKIPFSNPTFFGKYTGAATQYSRVPNFHLIVAITREVLNVDYREGVLLSISLTQTIIFAIVLYLLGIKIFHNHAVGMLAAIFGVSAEHVMYMNSWSTPNTLGGVFLMVIVLVTVMVLKNNKENKGLFYPLLFIFIVATTLTHIISTIAMFVLFYVTLLFFVFSFFVNRWTDYKTSQNVKTSNIIIFSILLLVGTIFTLIWWVYFSGYWEKIISLLGTGFKAKTLIRGHNTAGYQTSMHEIVISIFPVILFHLLALFGFVYYWIKMRKKITTHYLFLPLVMVGGIFAILGSAPRLLGLTLLEHRWWYFSESILALCVAVLILQTLMTKRVLLKFISIFVLILYFYLTITEPQYVSIDNNSYFEENNFRYAVTTSEIYSTKFIGECSNNSVIKTDEYFSFVLNNLHFKSKAMNTELYTGRFAKNEEENGNNSYIAIRTYILYHPIKLNQYLYKLDYNPENLLSNESQFYKIYSSQGIELFYRD